MKKKQKIVILLGGNVGDTLSYFKEAISQLEKVLDITVKRSSVYRSTAWGKTEQKDFLNQVLLFEASIPNIALLELCQKIEIANGRVRKETWAERTLDIDILYIGNEIIHEARLMVPHPYLQKRRFTLLPLVEILAEFTHPVLLKTQKQLLEQCDDEGLVTIADLN
jgi:2-amino-4-hydroxy-6-hydroxymethyldihydropteridine diphosphokinase